MHNASWKKDGGPRARGCGFQEKDGGSGTRMTAPTDSGGPGHQDVGSGRKMTLQIEAERPRSQDAGPGRKTRAQDAKKTAIQEKRTPGKLKNGPGKQSSRPDRKKTGRTVKTVVGNRQSRFLSFSRAWDGLTEEELGSWFGRGPSPVLLPRAWS